MSTTNVTLGSLFETIGRLHIQVEALQSEVGKRDAIIAGYAKEKEAQQASKVPPPLPEDYKTTQSMVEEIRRGTPDA